MTCVKEESGIERERERNRERGRRRGERERERMREREEKGNRDGAVTDSVGVKNMNSSMCDNAAGAEANIRKTATKDCPDERSDGRTHRGALWLGILCLVLCGMMQETEKKAELTRVSKNMDSLYFESEADQRDGPQEIR